ncbi:Sterol 3-beta-glucosyltransferase [Coccomyxa sp. Obi]|nr:Sterol 3-beta-glucosyltransferase [Coccomyxa sp. Obi]
MLVEVAKFEPMYLGSSAQPFVAVGLKLKEHGHRVRVATHSQLRSFVEQFGLEFYPLGGDPQVLADFAVQSKGVFPRGLGQVKKVRQQIKAYVAGQLAACTEADPDHPDLAFKEFAHPQARFLHEKRHALPPRLRRHFQPFFGAVNRASFKAIDGAMFVGTGDILAKFRKDVLGQPSLLSLKHYHRPLHYCGVPVSYCWSPTLLPQPADWPATAEVVGFCQLEASDRMNYSPSEDLVQFLAAGPPPVYIGFGSMTLKHPHELARIVFTAVKEMGVRAVIGAGWGGLGVVDDQEIPEGVYILRQRYVPHDWLFRQCTAVVHHGGAGTTGAGLAAGCPTMAIPFFGDQAFWGEMCRRSGVGPAPIAVEKLTSELLKEGLQFLMRPEVKAAAQHLASRMAQEPEGTQAAVDSFHRHLRGRLPQRASAPTLVGSDSASSLPLADAEVSQATCRVLDAASISGPQQTAAAGATGREDAVAVADIESGVGMSGRPHTPMSANGNVTGEQRGRRGSGSMEQDRESNAREEMVSGEVRSGGVRYFERKKVPVLTGWWESACAFGAVFLLPLISIVPCATTAVRDDDVVVCSQSEQV